MNLNNQTKIWLILVTLWMINGSSFLAIKVAIDTIPPLLSAGLRFSIAGAVLFSLYYIQLYRKNSKDKSTDVKNISMVTATDTDQSRLIIPKEIITLRQWKDSLILGLTLFLGGQGLLTWGTQYLSSGMAGLLNSTIPL